MKMKIFSGLLILIAIISISFNLKMLYDQKKQGEVEELQQLVVATVFELQKQGYEEKDIQEIKMKNDYSLLKGRGTYPYNYIVYVVTKDEPDHTKTYTWADDNKTAVKLQK